MPGVVRSVSGVHAPETTKRGHRRGEDDLERGARGGRSRRAAPAPRGARRCAGQGAIRARRRARPPSTAHAALRAPARRGRRARRSAPEVLGDRLPTVRHPDHRFRAGRHAAHDLGRDGRAAPCRRAFSSRLRQSRRSRRSTTVAVTGSPRTSAATRAPSSARSASRSTGSASPTDSGASSRAAVSSSSMSSSSSAMSRSMLARRAGSPLQQLDRHPDPGERSAELVRRSGKDMPLRVHEPLDAIRRPVEALREPGDLVPSFHFDPRGERAGPELVHPGLQPLDPAREPARERPHPDRDRDREQGERPEPERQPMGEPMGGATEEAQRLHSGANLLRAAIQRPSSRRMTMGWGWPHAWCENVDSPRRRHRGGGTGGPTAATSRRDASYRVRSMRKRAERASRDARIAAGPAPGGGMARVRRCTSPERRPGRSLKSSSKTARPDPGRRPREHRERDEDGEEPEIDAKVEPLHDPPAAAPPEEEEGERENTYPTPRTVRIRRGRRGSSSMACRIRETCTSMLRSNASRSSPRTSCIRASRVSTWPARLARAPEQLELVAGDRPLLSFEPHDPGGVIDLQRPEPERLPLSRPAPCAGGGSRADGRAAHGG